MIKMLTSTMGAADERGSVVKTYFAGEELPLAQEWQKKLAETFVEMGVACEVADQVLIDEVKLDQEPKRRRTRKPRNIEA